MSGDTCGTSNFNCVFWPFGTSQSEKDVISRSDKRAKGEGSGNFDQLDAAPVRISYADPGPRALFGFFRLKQLAGIGK